MKLSDDWDHPVDPTDILPEPLRSSARRRRLLLQVGGAVGITLLIAALLGGDALIFVGKVWLYGSIYDDVFRGQHGR